MNARVPSRRYDSVQQDWRAFLPQPQAALFESHSRELETSYVAFSVALDEILGLRSTSWNLQLVDSISVCSALCSRLALRINSVLHGMRQRGRHFGILPNFADLEPINFRTERCQRAARSSTLVGRILLSRHSQFLHKLVTLERVVDALDEDFAVAIEQQAERPDPKILWRSLDLCHYDLNTCLRETLILFKSFLLVLPESQLDSLDFTIRGLCRSRHTGRAIATHVIRPRRMGAVAGK